MSNIKLPPVRQSYLSLEVGLDLVTPAISISPSKVIDSQNYKPSIGGGYRRVDGYERYNGTYKGGDPVSPTTTGTQTNVDDLGSYIIQPQLPV